MSNEFEENPKFSAKVSFDAEDFPPPSYYSLTNGAADSGQFIYLFIFLKCFSNLIKKF